MRRLFTVLTVVLISATLSFAQSVSNQDDPDSAPIRAGYAVVTPGTTSGLAVFQTFGLRQVLGGALQAAVLPPDLTTNALLFVDHDDKLAKNTGVAIVNPNNSIVSVGLTLRKKDGTVVGTTGTTPLTIAAGQQTAKLISELFPAPTAVPGEITGTLEITSTAPVSVIGLRFRFIYFSTIPATNLAGTSSPVPNIAANVGGPGAFLLPQFVTGDFWATEIVLINTTTTAMTVRVDLFKQDGTPLTAGLNGQTGSSFTGINVPAGGVVVLAPRDIDGDDDF